MNFTINNSSHYISVKRGYICQKRKTSIHNAYGIGFTFYKLTDIKSSRDNITGTKEHICNVYK